MTLRQTHERFHINLLPPFWGPKEDSKSEFSRLLIEGARNDAIRKEIKTLHNLENIIEVNCQGRLNARDSWNAFEHSRMPMTQNPLERTTFPKAAERKTFLFFLFQLHSHGFIFHEEVFLGWKGNEISQARKLVFSLLSLSIFFPFHGMVGGWLRYRVAQDLRWGDNQDRLFSTSLPRVPAYQELEFEFHSPILYSAFPDHSTYPAAGQAKCLTFPRRITSMNFFFFYSLMKCRNSSDQPLL